MMRSRSSARELEGRIDAAARLLADGLPRTAAVSQLAERFRVERRTARRYVALAAAQLAEEIGPVDLVGAMAESVERLRRLAWLAEGRGNLNAAVGAERAAASTLAAIYRADNAAAAMLSGRTLAVAEPSDRRRRQHRRSIRGEPPDACPF
jgi:hypothetical protein